MKVDWIVLGVVGFCVIILIFFLIKENLKDKEELTKFLNEESKNEEESELNNDDEK